MAKKYPERLLSDKLLRLPKSSKETLVFEVDDWGNKIEEVCLRLKVVCETEKLPGYRTGQRLVVVGLDAQRVRTRMAEASHDAHRAAMRRRQQEQDESRDENEDNEDRDGYDYEDEDEENEDDEDEEDEGEENYEDSRTGPGYVEDESEDEESDFNVRCRIAQSQGDDKGQAWDVTGDWEISCPCMEHESGSDHDDGCNFEIEMTKPTGKKEVQMFATFDLIVITGILRFLNPKDATKTKSKTPGQFLIPQESLPSANSREFYFRWRGEETGEGEIQLYSERWLCSLRFESSNTLSGFFTSDLTPKRSFKGIKREPAPRGTKRGPDGQKWAKYGPEDEWDSRDEEAYECARVGRWH